MYYVIGKLLGYWLHYVKIITLLAVITLLVDTRCILIQVYVYLQGSTFKVKILFNVHHGPESLRCFRCGSFSPSLVYR